MYHLLVSLEPPVNLRYITVVTPLLIFITAGKPYCSDLVSSDRHSTQPESNSSYTRPSTFAANMSDGRMYLYLQSPRDSLIDLGLVHTFYHTSRLHDPVLTTPSTVNDARAMRIAEIMTDFRNLQHYLSQLRATPTAEEYYLEGYSLLRSCASEAQTILQTPFSASTGASSGDPEREKQQLKT